MAGRRTGGLGKGLDALIPNKAGGPSKEPAKKTRSAVVKKEQSKPEKQETVPVDTKKAEVESHTNPQPAPSQDSEYEFPSLDLLSRPKKGSSGQSDRDLLQTAKKLK